jgi:hypothetical protein
MATVHAIEQMEPSSALLHMTSISQFLFCYQRGIQARSSFVEKKILVSAYSCWNSQTPLHLFYINRASGSEEIIKQSQIQS